MELAGATGLEPATSGVTGRRSNQLSYAPNASAAGVKEPTPRVKRPNASCVAHPHPNPSGAL